LAILLVGQPSASLQQQQQQQQEQLQVAALEPAQQELFAIAA